MLSGKIFEIKFKKVGVKSTSNPVSLFSKHYFICYSFLQGKLGIFEQKSIHCVNRHDYLCSSREMEVVGPLPKIDHIFAIIIYGNHEDLISLLWWCCPLANHTLLALFGAEVNSFLSCPQNDEWQYHWFRLLKTNYIGKAYIYWLKFFQQKLFHLRNILGRNIYLILGRDPQTLHFACLLFPPRL